MSSDTGSSLHTSRIIRPVLVFLFPHAPEPTLRLYHHYIRKAAHFTEYAVLAVLLCRMMFISRPAFRYWAVAVVLIVAAVASLDELNQSLVSSRTASAYDSLLDIAGGIFAVLVIWLLRRRHNPARQ